jgi:drug/metabolite transporter (DMT)-like permease
VSGGAPKRQLGGLAVAALAAQSVFLGYNWVVMKIGLRYSDVWPFTALRTGLGSLALFIVLLVLRRPLRPTQVWRTALLGLLQTTGMIGLLMWALQSGAAGRVSALVYTMPVWALLLGRAFLGERIVGLQWAAAASALACCSCSIRPTSAARGRARFSPSRPACAGRQAPLW